MVRRTTIGIGNLSPPRVQTNVQVPCVNMGRGQLYFLPDTILYRDNNGYGAIAYSDFRLAQGFTRFIESDGVPAEATVVDHTWRYVNKNGGPPPRSARGMFHSFRPPTIFEEIGFRRHYSMDHRNLSVSRDRRRQTTRSINALSRSRLSDRYPQLKGMAADVLPVARENAPAGTSIEAQ